MNLPLSLVVDRSGVYYDASGASDLENLIARAATNVEPSVIERARRAMESIRTRKLSKYNHAPLYSPAELGLGFAAEGGTRSGRRSDARRLVGRVWLGGRALVRAHAPGRVAGQIPTPRYW